MLCMTNKTLHNEMKLMYSKVTGSKSLKLSNLCYALFFFYGIKSDDT